MSDVTLAAARAILAECEGMTEGEYEIDPSPDGRPYIRISGGPIVAKTYRESVAHGTLPGNVNARAIVALANGRPVIAALIAEVERLRAGQTYRYVGRDGKAVLARDLEDRAEAAEADRDRLKAQVRRLEEELAAAHSHTVDLGNSADHYSEERDRLRQENERLRALVDSAIGIFTNCSIEAGVCCCGDEMKAHSSPLHCGHPPVDMGAYQADLWLKSALTALNGEASNA